MAESLRAATATQLRELRLRRLWPAARKPVTVTNCAFSIADFRDPSRRRNSRRSPGRSGGARARWGSSVIPCAASEASKTWNPAQGLVAKPLNLANRARSIGFALVAQVSRCAAILALGSSSAPREGSAWLE